jgi:hypothetical protein
MRFSKGCSLAITETATTYENFEVKKLQLPPKEIVEANVTRLGDAMEQTADSGERVATEAVVTVTLDLANQPTVGEKATLTVTFPLLQGETTAGTCVIKGIMTKLSNPTMEPGGAEMTQDITVKQLEDYVLVAGS